MRCKACDSILSANELVEREETGELDDLCLICRKASDAGYEDEDEELAMYIPSLSKITDPSSWDT